MSQNPHVAAYRAYHARIGLGAPSSPVVPVSEYPGELPRELHDFYMWTPVGGHCLLVLSIHDVERLERGRAPGEGVHTLLVPMPIKSVLRGWHFYERVPVAHVVVYSDTYGYQNPYEELDRELEPTPCR